MAESVAPKDVPASTNGESPPEADCAGLPRAAETPGESAPRGAMVFWLRRSDQVVLAVLCGLLVLLSAAHWARLSGWGMRAVEIGRHPSRRYEYRIDVNTATWVEWIQLPGVGEMLARRIIEDRERNGPFGMVDDLARVKGIGPKTIESLRPYLRVNTAAGDERPD